MDSRRWHNHVYGGTVMLKVWKKQIVLKLARAYYMAWGGRAKFLGKNSLEQDFRMAMPSSTDLQLVWCF